MSAKKTPVYPIVLNVCLAMGAKRKEPVIRAINIANDEDMSKVPVYPTLRNAFVAGVNLIKHSENGKWLKITKEDTAAGKFDPPVSVTAIKAQAKEEAAAARAVAKQEAAERKAVAQAELAEAKAKSAAAKAKAAAEKAANVVPKVAGKKTTAKAIPTAKQAVVDPKQTAIKA